MTAHSLPQSSRQPKRVAFAGKSVRGRLAPSPTGRLHLGNAYAFLMAWLSVRSQGGALVLRMEDIDPDRSRPAFVRGILEDLAWLGLDWDEGPAQGTGGEEGGEGDSPVEPRTKAKGRGGPCGPYTQSLRLPLYEAVLDELRQRGVVYPCFCTRKELRMLASAPHIGDEGAPYPGTCRTLTEEERAAHRNSGRQPALRLHTGDWQPAGGFTDRVRGEQPCNPAAVGGDFALRRSDGVFAYQLAVVADDAAMGITEVVRGEDLLASTPRQLFLFHLLGQPAPVYAHIPLLHDAAGERLAKRHKGLELAALRSAGISPAAVTGFLGYVAGLLPEPRPAVPADLLPHFSLAVLAGRRLMLPENVMEVLRALAP